MNALGRSFVVLVYGVFLFAPLLWMLGKASASAASPKVAELLARAEVQVLLANSIYLGLATTFFAVLLGFPLALLVSWWRFPGRSLVGRLYFLPLLVPPHIHAIAWARVLGDRGWITAWFSETFGVAFNVRAPLGDPVSDDILGHVYLGPAWIMACAFYPLVTLAVSSGLRGLDPETLEAGRLHGGGRRAFWRIVMPEIAPRLVAGALFVFVLALSTFPVVSLLDTPVLIQKVFFTFSQVDQSAGAVMALPLVVVAAAAIALFGFAAKAAPSRPAAQRALAPRKGGVRHLIMTGALLALANGVSFGSLLYFAGPLRFWASPEAAPGGPSAPAPLAVDNYQSVFSRVHEAFAGSFLLAGAGVVALLVVSWPLGRLVARRGFQSAEALSLGMLAFPHVVVGVALLLFWTAAARGDITWPYIAGYLGLLAFVLVLGRRPNPRRLAAALGCVAGAAILVAVVAEAGVASIILERTLVLPVLAYLALFLPFTARLFRNGFLAMDPEEEEAARLAGHGRLSRALRVELPRLGGVIAATAVLAWVLCFTELDATLMALRPGWQSVQIRIFSMVHYQSIGEVAALCVLSVVAAALPVLLLGLVARRRWEVL